MTLVEAVKIVHKDYVSEEGEHSLIETMLILFKELTAREVNSWGADVENVDAYELIFNSERSAVAAAIESLVKE